MTQVHVLCRNTVHFGRTVATEPFIAYEDVDEADRQRQENNRSTDKEIRLPDHVWSVHSLTCVGRAP